MDGVGVRLHDAERMLRRLLDTWDEGHMLREGVRIVIAGRPNVGKSTLLNALLGMEKAIVTHIPGTTRDIIEDNLVINGYPVILCDTAGLRATDCEIEAEGIRRARKAVLHADIVLYVLDGSRGVDGDDLREMGLVPKPRTIVVVNKADLGIRVDLDSFRTDWSVCSVCATSREGIDQLRSEIAEKLEKRSPSHPGAVISERHRRLLIATLKDVTEAKMIFSERPAGPTLSASKLRSALDALGEVTGRVYQDELLDSIFSRFCIGK
jgi:tRNA modification GTPase